jgi:hypothetical protein
MVTLFDYAFSKDYTLRMHFGRVVYNAMMVFGVTVLLYLIYIEKRIFLPSVYVHQI